MTTRGFFTRFAIITGLIIVLMIPLLMVKGLVDERADRRDETVREVSSKWGEKQVIAGPFLEVPERIGGGYLLVTPSKLTINGELIPEVRSRGIYDVPLYSSKLDIQAEFNSRNLDELKANSDLFAWDRSQVVMLVPNLRGLKEQLKVSFNGQNYQLGKGTASGKFDGALSATTPIEDLYSPGKNYKFSTNLNLQGSMRLGFLPLADETSVDLKSSWQSPSFVGGYLPSNQLVTSDGFEASWQVSALNTKFSPVYRYNRNDYEPLNYRNSGEDNYLAVDLYLENDVYRLTDRSTKYGFFIIVLVFGTLFFVEQFTRKRINPIQYLLIGLALVIFYLLLLAFAEYIRFFLAYLIAAGAVLGLLVWFTTVILKSKHLGTATGGVLALCYGFNYYLLQSSDYTLLTGSMAAFFVLAMAMYMSKYLTIDDAQPKIAK